MTTKLEIIGPYTPDHPGPFCTRDGKPVRILCTDGKGIPPIVGLAQDGDIELIVIAWSDGVTRTMSRNYDIMSAREVRVPREFWINEYEEDLSTAHTSLEAALSFLEVSQTFARTIHVREVLEGDCNCRTDTQLFDDIEKVKYYPNFIQEDDGWYASTSLREPSGPYASLQAAVCAVVCDGFDGDAS